MERNVFIGPQVHEEVKVMIKKIQKLEKASFRKIIQGNHLFYGSYVHLLHDVEIGGPRAFFIFWTEVLK